MRSNAIVNTLLYRSITLLILLVAAGCSALPPPLPQENVYLLEAGAVGSPLVTSPSADRVIVVSPLRARAGFDTDRMIWVHQSYELDVYARNRWADTPARMIAPLITQTLQRSGAFHAVVPEPTVVPAKTRLEVELIRLQQDFTVKPSQVRFTLGARLIEVDTRKIFATAEFDEREPCQTEDAYGGVLAANRALERLLTKLATFAAKMP